MYLHGAGSLKLVGHILIEIPFLVNCFLPTHPKNFIVIEITNPRRFLHSNAIEHVDDNAFSGLNNLDFLDCAPSTTFYVLVFSEEVDYTGGLRSSGFVCNHCKPGKLIDSRCVNCSLCAAGFYNDIDGLYGSCRVCPAGGFYQDQMGQVDCKRCSVGTFVSEEAHPGTSISDCLACPYGTLSNETAGYRACKCLQNFYRLDRFGPCTACPLDGFVWKNDTAILAPGYFWKWPRKTERDQYKNFVFNIYSYGSNYNSISSKFPGSLPIPLKCPHIDSCKGGIDSECHEGYQGTLCATCTGGFYFRFNSCLKCPRLSVAITSSVLVVVLFVTVFLMVLWGDSKRTENNRTIADIIMSCFKIVIGFYQVIAGIFSALKRVRWPVALISMEEYLKLVEGNILQFAPLSCIHSQLRIDQFVKFVVAICVNVLVVGLIFLYLILKKRYIEKKMDRPNSDKEREILSLKKSCYRNIFLFLLTSDPATGKSIIQILPLPGACVKTCFTDDMNDCISLLRADYSIQCFTSRHSLYWLIAAVFSLYPIGFPLLALFLTYKYRESQENEAIKFGLRVFFENYKNNFWFWEIIEMYRKLILISLIFLFGSEGLSQVGLTILTVSAFGVAYTFFRPLKSKFEDRLQTFVLWIIFFDVCLGAVYTNWDVRNTQNRDNSIFMNVLFLTLNASVLLLAIAKGFLHLKSFWKKVYLCPIYSFSFCRRGIVRLKSVVVAFFRRFSLKGTRSESSDDALVYFIQD
ncbi:putative leucine-rich repeat-containing protein DDB_G0281931 [Stylophora pistillata]|uniref:putative leucine-rich repeat-containing protein DDB_G0281931 n=1 Tax=Stylophora pistillata TaxID=50429 RepID=UPI000C0393AD|nr:putative leucine-rich repeat-containing protein DDB_G0281931 [Stylophora pistillata]